MTQLYQLVSKPQGTSCLCLPKYYRYRPMANFFTWVLEIQTWVVMPVHWHFAKQIITTVFMLLFFLYLISLLSEKQIELGWEFLLICVFKNNFFSFIEEIIFCNNSISLTSCSDVVFHVFISFGSECSLRCSVPHGPFSSAIEKQQRALCSVLQSHLWSHVLVLRKCHCCCYYLSPTGWRWCFSSFVDC